VEQRTDTHKKIETEELAPGREDRGQLLRWDHFELSIGAVRGLLVRSPATKLCRVTEAISLHVIIGDFDHQFRA
jgi:hypothetical protein